MKWQAMSGAIAGCIMVAVAFLPGARVSNGPYAEGHDLTSLRLVVVDDQNKPVADAQLRLRAQKLLLFARSEANGTAQFLIPNDVSEAELEVTQRDHADHRETLTI